jgi:hypothetical protein
VWLQPLTFQQEHESLGRCCESTSRNGIPPKEIKEILGQVALQNLSKDQVLQFDQIGRPLDSVKWV